MHICIVNPPLLSSEGYGSWKENAYIYVCYMHIGIVNAHPRARVIARVTEGYSWGYRSCQVYVYVCVCPYVCVTLILALRAIQCPTKGTSSFSHM